MSDGNVIRAMLILALTLVVACLRLGELALSRHWLIRSGHDSRAEVLREPVYPFMVALHALWLAGSLAEPLVLERPMTPWLSWPMGAMWLMAIGLKLWMFAAMGRLWNVRIVRRTPQPVVTGGPYRFIRHPNYLAVIVEIAVIPLMTGAWWTALAASAANGLVLIFRIRREEAYLFGNPAYRAAFSAKKRFIPGVF